MGSQDARTVCRGQDKNEYGSGQNEASNQDGDRADLRSTGAEGSQGLGNLLDTRVFKEECPAHWAFGGTSATENTGRRIGSWG